MSKKRSQQNSGAAVPSPSLPDDARLDRAVEPEYASVSGLAIFALLLATVGVVAFLPLPAGLPLPMTWFRLPILLLVPLTTLPFSVAAIRQIRSSAGTKVGIALAHSALALSLIFAIGAGTVHGLSQWEHHKRQQTLVSAAEGILSAILNNQPDTVLAALIRSGVATPADRDKFLMHWNQTQRLLHDDGGGKYYGIKLNQIGAYKQDTKDESEARYDIGVVVHRLQFKRAALDLKFQFSLIEEQWKLVGITESQALVLPGDNAKPKRRFEP
jgi:hypothetical protein